MVVAFSIIFLGAVSQAPAPPKVATTQPFSATAKRVALERLIRAPDVQAALGVGESAKADLHLLHEERVAQADRVRRLLELAPGASRAKLLTESVAEPATSPGKVAETLKQILGDQKFARLRQIQRQLLGPAVVFELTEELGLTTDQRSRLFELSGVERSRGTSRSKDSPEFHQQQLAEVRKMLSTDQQRILDDQLGAPSGVISKEPVLPREFGLNKPPQSVWHATQRSPVIYLGFPEVRSWLELSNWSDIENLLVEENDVEAVVAHTCDRLPSTDAELLAERALKTRSERMSRLEESVFGLLSARQGARLKSLKYQVFDSAPYSWPTADLLGVTDAQRAAYVKARRTAMRAEDAKKRLAEFEPFQFLTPDQRKKWDAMRGEPVPGSLRQLCSAVGDTRWRPQLREGLAAMLSRD